MTDPVPDRNDDDEFDVNDLEAAFAEFRRNRPREHPPKPPTLEDSALWHGIAGQTVPVNIDIPTEGGVTRVTENITIGRPVLGPIQEEDSR